MEALTYTIYNEPITTSLFRFFKLNAFSNVAILVDENTKLHCYPLVKDVLPPHYLIEISSGEEYKTLDTCTKIWNALTNQQFDRKSLLVNLGGGVIGDMGGFCAATYKRGISFIQIPTTLLSQVDASVGGKLGIDFLDFKNQIGLFANPQAVFVDTKFLLTLEKRHFNSGLAEVIKHALIQDEPHFEYLEKYVNKLNIESVVERSIEIKKKIVEQDFKEFNIRKTLNFGHTVGHAIESFLLVKNPILHGEAVAAGIICESYISNKLGKLSFSEFERIERLINSIFSRIPILEEDFSSILKLMHQDKKNENQHINFSLLSGIGSCDFDQFISEKIILESLTYYFSH